MKKSKYKGVSWHKGAKMWQAQITMARLGIKSMHLGYFKTEEEAAEAFNEAKTSYIGRIKAKCVTRRYA